MHSAQIMTAGMFYWIRSVQTYDSGGWNYIDNLKAFVQGGLKDDSFIDSVSGIVNRVRYSCTIDESQYLSSLFESCMACYVRTTTQ